MKSQQNGTELLTRPGLFSGLEAKSQSQVGTALQVYFNLGVLQEKLHQLVSDQIKGVATSLKDCLDPKKIEVAVIEQLPAAAIQQVSSLTQFFYSRLFIKKSLICLEGKSMTHCQQEYCSLLFLLAIHFFQSVSFKNLKFQVSDWLLKIFNQ